MKYEIVDESEFINLTQLAKEAFPDLVEITALRKASENFKAICTKYNIEIEKYIPKNGRDYKIPATEKKRWVLGVRHINVATKNNPSKKQIIAFVEDLITMKTELECTIGVNVTRDFDNIRQSDYARIVNFYYTNSEIREFILQYEFWKLEDRIQEDFEYILSKAETKNVIEYTESYIKEALKKVDFLSAVTKRLIEEEDIVSTK